MTIKPHKIQWCTKTWNPIIGCSHASPGCDHCYAERMAARQVAMGTRGYAEVVENGRWNGRTVLVKSELDKPLRWRNPQRIFVCSMSDLFHESVPYEWIGRVMSKALCCPEHTFLFLTKRAKRMRDFVSRFHSECERKHLRNGNFHCGVTCESNDYRWRIEELVNTPAAKRFVSVEPMLGPVDLRPYIQHIDGVICGGESGPGARPIHPDNVRSLRDQCAEAGVPFMFKQWGEWAPASALDSSITPSTTGFHESVLVDGVRMYRVGKHRAGRLLDGRVHDEVAK